MMRIVETDTTLQGGGEIQKIGTAENLVDGRRAHRTRNALKALSKKSQMKKTLSTTTPLERTPLKTTLSTVTASKKKSPKKIL